MPSSHWQGKTPVVLFRPVRSSGARSAVLPPELSTRRKNSRKRKSARKNRIKDLIGPPRDNIPRSLHFLLDAPLTRMANFVDPARCGPGICLKSSATSTSLRKSTHTLWLFCSNWARCSGPRRFRKSSLYAAPSAMRTRDHPPSFLQRRTRVKIRRHRSVTTMIWACPR